MDHLDEQYITHINVMESKGEGYLREVKVDDQTNSIRKSEANVAERKKPMFALVFKRAITYSFLYFS